MKYWKRIKTPIGEMIIIEEEKRIIEVKIKEEVSKEIPEAVEKDTKLLEEASKQLQEYFKGTRKQFNLPLNPKGTPFMQNVWKTLEKIPYGEVRSYQEIAQKMGVPKAVRAVGMANHRNPIPIIIPCHRVIGSNGKLVGYALGLEMKQFLLNLEERGKENV